MSEGDSIKMTVTATSDTAGTAVIENETTGTTVTKSFSGNVEGDLCRTNAEWIVEDVSCLNLSPFLPDPSNKGIQLPTKQRSFANNLLCFCNCA